MPNYARTGPKISAIMNKNVFTQMVWQAVAGSCCVIGCKEIHSGVPNLSVVALVAGKLLAGAQTLVQSFRELSMFSVSHLCYIFTSFPTGQW